MTGPIDYQAVLADLEAKRGTLDAAIAGIKAILAGSIPETGTASENGTVAVASITSAVPAQGAKPAARGGTVTIESDTFFKLSTTAAIRKFLSIVKRPQTAKAIAEALRAGGQLHAIDEATAYRNSYSALLRLKKSEVMVQTRNGEWALSEWYDKASGPESDA